MRITPVLLVACLPLLGMDDAHKTYVEHKAAHALIGMGICYAGAKLGHPKTGIAIALTLGIAKEIYDQKHGGKFRGGDVAWTTMPGVVLTYSIKW